MSELDPPLQPYVRLSRNQKKRKMTAGKRRQIMERDNYLCVLCGTGEELTLDHILPLSEGGTNGNSNLRVLCHACNQRERRTRLDGRQALGWPISNEG